MSGPITRKIELGHQIQEAELSFETPPRAASPAIADERVLRRRAILETLRFNQKHEHLFRVWMAERRGDGTQFRMVRGTLCWRSGDMAWSPIDEDAANAFLERFDAPATQERAAE